MEPIINSQLPEFKVQAFQNGSFKTVTNEDVKGKLYIKRGMMLPKASARLNIRCWQTRQVH